MVGENEGVILLMSIMAITFAELPFAAAVCP
jgi:hypothetical protein